MPTLDRRPEVPAPTVESRPFQLVRARTTSGPLRVSEEPHVDGTQIGEGGAGLVVRDVRALEAERRLRVDEVRHGETEAGEVEVVAVPGPAANRDEDVGLERKPDALPTRIRLQRRPQLGLRTARQPPGFESADREPRPVEDGRDQGGGGVAGGPLQRFDPVTGQDIQADRAGVRPVAVRLQILEHRSDGHPGRVVPECIDLCRRAGGRNETEQGEDGERAGSHPRSVLAIVASCMFDVPS
jgi:hypothetical protein